jgi:hypothetical protein
MHMKKEIETAVNSSSTIGLGMKVIPEGVTEKEDVQDILHLLCNATELVLYLFT